MNRNGNYRNVLIFICWLNVIVAGLALVVFLSGCAEGDRLTVSFPDDDEIAVEPVARHHVGNGEWETVFVFYERGKGKKPKVEEECSDLNTNQLFSELDVCLPSPDFFLEYHPAFEPVVGFLPVDRALGAWETSSGEFADVVEIVTGSAPPGRDGKNVVGWRRFVGPGGDFLAAAFIWDDGERIREADVFFNLKHRWTVGPSIEPGSTLCGEQFDVQAVATHEFGHVLGLGHVPDSDATMAPTAAKGELAKQTLTPGDVAGAIEVSP